MTKELVARRCIMEQVKRLAGNEIESALCRLEGGGWIGDFYEFFTEEFAGEEIP